MFKPTPGFSMGEEKNTTKSNPDLFLADKEDAAKGLKPTLDPKVDSEDEDLVKDCNKSAQESLEMLKGISANALSMLRKREEQIMQQVHDVSNSDLLTSLRRVGTARRASNHEPPIVPVRRIEAPVYTPPVASEALTSCGGCGYIHKSLLTECPRCAPTRNAGEVVEYWKR